MLFSKRSPCFAPGHTLGFSDCLMFEIARKAGFFHWGHLTAAWHGSREPRDCSGWVQVGKDASRGARAAVVFGRAWRTRGRTSRRLFGHHCQPVTRE